MLTGPRCSGQAKPSETVDSAVGNFSLHRRGGTKNRIKYQNSPRIIIIIECLLHPWNSPSEQYLREVQVNPIRLSRRPLVFEEAGLVEDPRASQRHRKLVREARGLDHAGRMLLDVDDRHLRARILITF